MTTESPNASGVAVRQFSPKDASSWNEFCLGRESTFVHDIAWREILIESYGYDARYFIMESKEGLVGVMPAVRIRSRIFGSRLVSMPFFEQGGPLLRDGELLVPLLGEVDSVLEHEGLEYLELRNPAGIGGEAVQSQRLSGDQYGYVTFRLSLKRPIEEVWRSTEKSAVRWAVRKAKSAGVLVVPVDAEDGLREFYAMYTTTMRRHGSPAHPYKFFQLIQRKLAPRIWLATYSGTPVAGILVFLHRG
ncbi:MAG TPA: hypothetical protein VGS04_08165, partial [Nitrososphaerales archaeon]|nr:hypothetical protein [Nitrososphaerales archaeon]